MSQEPQKTQQPKASHPMSAQDFAEWGANHGAYIRPIDLEGKTVYGVFSADGRQLGLTETLDLARAAVIQNDLEPVNVH